MREVFRRCPKIKRKARTDLTFRRHREIKLGERRLRFGSVAVFRRRRGRAVGKSIDLFFKRLIFAVHLLTAGDKALADVLFDLLSDVRIYLGHENVGGNGKIVELVIITLVGVTRRSQFFGNFV